MMIGKSCDLPKIYRLEDNVDEWLLLKVFYGLNKLLLVQEKLFITYYRMDPCILRTIFLISEIIALIEYLKMIPSWKFQLLYVSMMM